MGIVHDMHLYLVLLVFKKAAKWRKRGSGAINVCVLCSVPCPLWAKFSTLVVSIEKKKSFIYVFILSECRQNRIVSYADVEML